MPILPRKASPAFFAFQIKRVRNLASIPDPHLFISINVALYFSFFFLPPELIVIVYLPSGAGSRFLTS